MTHVGVRAVAIAVASVALLAGCGAPMGLGRKAYLVKPGTDNPVHIVRCEDRPRGGGQWAVTFLVPFGGFIGPAAGYEQCMRERTEQGYVEAPEPECAYWRDDAKPGDEIKIRDRCKDDPPEWTSRGVEAGKSRPHLAVAPTTPPRSSYTMLVGTWSGTVYGQQGSYPLTITFKDDGTYHAASATLKPGTFEGTWQLSGGTVVWKSITTGRTGTATVQETNGKRTLRLIPDDGTSTVELTPTTDAPADFRTWLRGNWAGSGGGYDLTISSDLNWEYTSTVRGRWYASGTARIEGPATIVLEGWFKGIGRAEFERLTMVLQRRGESLAGEFRLSQTWFVTFSRSSRPPTK